jgi:hypothetical protein
MYLTAQRVRSSSGREGVNIYLYTHRRDPPQLDWNHVDVSSIADKNPGYLEAAVTSIPGPGNTVRSFLDVVGPDSVSHAELATRLQRAMAAFPGIDQAQATVAWSNDELALRYFPGTDWAHDPTQELRELTQALLPVLGSGVLVRDKLSRLAISRPNPLLVRVERDEIGYVYRLTDDSRNYLQQLLPRHVIPITLSVPYDIHQELSGNWQEFATALTHLDRNGLNAVAGIVFVDADTAATLWDSRDPTVAND